MMLTSIESASKKRTMSAMATALRFLGVIVHRDAATDGTAPRTTPAGSPSERDPRTGSIRRDWDTRWELVSSTEGSRLAAVLDMWFVGLGLLVVGPGIYLLEDSILGRRRTF